MSLPSATINKINHNSMQTTLNNQTGMAIITVLLLVVSITVLATVMLVSQNMATRKSSLLFKQNQLIQEIQAGQQLTLKRIEADTKLNDFDSYQDVWAEEIPARILENGHSIEFSIRDDATKFNLNNLYHDGKVDIHAFKAFKKLLTLLELDISIAKAVLDWQDPDKQVYLDEADEDVFYKEDGKSKVTNQLFVSVDQLADLPNVTPKMVSILKQYVTAVPYWLPVNVNTANETVLLAIVGEENQSSLRALIVRRENQPVRNQEELEGLSLFANTKLENNNPNPTANPTPVVPKKKGDDKEVDNKVSETKKQTEKQKLAKLIQQKKKILDIQSHAFESLITVSDGDKDEPKKRYAIVKISKLSEQSNNKKKKSQVKIYSNRMWAFKPYFLK